MASETLMPESLVPVRPTKRLYQNPHSQSYPKNPRQLVERCGYCDKSPQAWSGIPTSSCGDSGWTAV